MKTSRLKSYVAICKRFGMVPTWAELKQYNKDYEASTLYAKEMDI